jgi:hypothetical protein
MSRRRVRRLTGVSGMALGISIFYSRNAEKSLPIFSRIFFRRTILGRGTAEE